MKSIFKIYRRYVVTACLLVAFVVCINLAVWAGYAFWLMGKQEEAGSDGMPIRMGKYHSVAADLKQNGKIYVLGETGEAVLRESNCTFLLLLDGAGNVVFDWQKPGGFPDRFSAGQIGAFSKWYLMDYPVAVWRYGEEGLLVFGYPKDSMVRYNPVWRKEELQGMLQYIGIFVQFNIILVLALAFFFGYQLYRSLKPVGEGIDALSEGKVVLLREKGVTQELRRKMNQTSRLLERQQKELARRDTARTEWIAGVSHDIRTPLSLIVGYADEIASDGEQKQDVRQKAEGIRTQSFVIKKLVEDLNLTSKLTYRVQPLRKQDYVPAIWLRSTVSGMINSGEIPESCEVELQAEPVLEQQHMTGDVQLLTRALQNLLGNSVRHNPGGCRIVLEAKEAEEGFCFCVRDSGKGIPQKVREILQDEDTIAYREKEQGQADRGPHVMGLFVVKQIVCAHGGTLWFEEEGRQVWVSVRNQREEGWKQE